MHSYRVTFPRSSFFVIFIIGWVGVLLVLLTDPLFLAERSIRDLLPGRWIALAAAALFTLWGAKGMLFPKEIFRCDRSGVYLSGVPGVIPWEHVQAIGRAKIEVGFSRPQRPHVASGPGTPIVHEAVELRFDHTVKLNPRGPKGSHGRPTGESAYAFSTGVKADSADEVMATINRIREGRT